MKIRPQAESIFAFFKTMPVVFCCFFLSACLSRLYPGPERPQSAISTVYFHAPVGIRLAGIRIDESELSAFSSGAELLPGPHHLALKYFIDSQACFSGQLRCPSNNYSGVCNGTINTSAGQSYSVTINFETPSPRHSPSISITSRQFMGFVEGSQSLTAGSGSCE